MRYMLRLCLLVLCIALPTTEGVAQWKKSTNLPAGYTSTYWLDVFFLPSNPQYGWVCGFNGHVLRTTDGGNTWQGSQVPSSANLESIHFVGTSIGYTSGAAGIFKSVDGGATWTNITPSGNPPLWGCYFLNADVGMVVGGGCGVGAGTYQFFFRTTDGGQNWSLYLDSVPNTGLTDVILYSATGLGYAASSGRIWRTDNGGQNWAVADTSGPVVWNEEITNINSSFLVPVAGSECGGGGLGGGMLFTTDNGTIWRDYTTGVPMFGTYLLNTTTGWACGDGRSVYYTADGGLNWQLRNCGIEAGDLDDIWFINENSGWVVGQGVYKYLWPPYDKKTDTLQYGEVCIPDTKLDTAIIYNRNSSASQMTVLLGGPDGSQFELVSPASVSIPACDSARVIIRFRPSSTGAKTAVASLAFPAGNLSVQLRGTGRIASATPIDTLVTINPAQVGVVTTGSIRWRNTSGMTETITVAERLDVNSLIALMPGFPPLPIGGFGATIYTYATPVDTGWISTRFRFRIAPCNTDTTVTVRIYGVSPIITVADTVKVNLSCRNEIQQLIPVSNTGNAPLVIKSGSFSGPQASDYSLLTSLPKTIQPGVTDTLIVRFRPVGQGIRQAALELVNNDSTSARGRKNPRRIALRGAFSKASFSTSFPQVNLGDVCVGDSAEISVVINGDAVIDGTAVKWTTKTPAVFRVAEPAAFPVVLPAKQPTQFLVRFRPGTASSFSDTLRIYVEPCDTVFVFVVKGRGIAPAAVVATTDASVTAPTDTDVALAISLNNPTAEPEQLVALEVVDGSPAIRFTGGALPLQIPAGTMQLKFTGNVPDTGWFSARYRVVTQKGECRRDTIITVRVYGISPVLDTHSDLYFVLGTCNDSAIDTVFVHNAGNDTLLLGPISAPFGAHAGDFLVLGTTRSGSILPGDSVGIILRFSPGAPGKRTASISFEHNDKRSGAALPHPFVLNLIGERGFVLINSEPMAVQFDTVCIGTRKEVLIQMRNTGTVKAFIVNVQTTSQEYEVSVPGKTLPLELGSEQVGVLATFAPQTTGYHRDTIIVSLEPCGERHTFVVEGFAGETKIEAVPATLVLGDIRTGVPTTRTVKLKSIGNLPARIEPGAIAITPVRDDITLQIATALPVVLEPGSDIDVVVEFFPKTDTTFSGELCIAGTEACPFSLCIPISASSTRSQLAVTSSDFGLVRCFEAVFDTVEVHNIGTEKIEILDVTIEPLGTPFAIVNSTGFILQPGGVATVIIRALPTSDGVYNATLVLHTDTEGKREREIVLEYRRAELSLSATEGLFGIHERCAGTLEIPVTVTSVGSLPDTVIIRRKHDVTGFSSVPADTVIILPANSSVVGLRATTGDFTAAGIIRDTFLLHSTACGDYAISVSIDIIDSRLVADPTDINLGSLPFGATRDTIVEISAVGARRNITGLVVEPSSSNFYVDPNPLPIAVQPGLSVDIPVHYTADRQGVDNARLLVIHEGDCRDTTVVLLRADVPDNVFRLSFAFGRYTAAPGDTLAIPLRYSGALPRLPMASLRVIAHFDRWLLQPLEIVVGDDLIVPFDYVDNTLAVTLDQATMAAAGAAFGRDGRVFMMRAVVLNSFPPSTPLAIDSVLIATDAAHELLLTNGLLTVDGSCEPVARVLRRLGMVSVRGIAPQPATDRIVLMLGATAEQRVQIEVYDSYGRIWFTDNDVAIAAGESTLAIDADRFPAGVYLIRIISPVDTEVVRCSLVK